MGTKISKTEIRLPPARIAPDPFPSMIKLTQVIDVNGYAVMCQAAKNPKDETVIALVTSKQSDVKQLVITGTGNFARDLRCGGPYGSGLSTPNEAMKASYHIFGKDVGGLVIKFYKQQGLACCSPCCLRCCCVAVCCCLCRCSPCCFQRQMKHHGLIALPESLKGYLIVFYWPDDQSPHGGPSDEELQGTEQEKKTEDDGVEGFDPNVIRTGEAADILLSVFKLRQ